MLPMTKNIFHRLRDDARSCPTSSAAAMQSVAMGGPEPADSRRPKLRAHPQVPEGLRILLIQQRADQKGETSSSHIVIKSFLNISSTSTTPRRGPDPKVSSPELGFFLKTCFLCKKELSPHKDVYMYRGDQGYCSPECRRRQILSDERRELSHGHRRRATGSKIRASAPQNRRILLAA